MSNPVAIAQTQSALLPCPAITITTHTNLCLTLNTSSCRSTAGRPLTCIPGSSLHACASPSLSLSPLPRPPFASARQLPRLASPRLDSPVSSHSRPKRLSRRRCCCCSATTDRRQTTDDDDGFSQVAHRHKVRRPSKQLPKNTTPRTLGSCSIHTAGATLSAYPTERRAYRIHLTALPLDPRSSLPPTTDPIATRRWRDHSTDKQKRTLGHDAFSCSLNRHRRALCTFSSLRSSLRQAPLKPTADSTSIAYGPRSYWLRVRPTPNLEQRP